MITQETISTIGCFVTILSLVGNIVQYMQKKNHEKNLRAHLQATYNMFFQIARAETKVRNNISANDEEKSNALRIALERITGTSDAARTTIIAYSRETMDFIPFYEHPAFPGEEMPNEVKFGTPPEYANKCGANKEQQDECDATTSFF